MPPAVAVDSLSKAFAIPHERVHTLKERALHPFRRRTSEVFGALRDVSFAVEPGEFFGIVGRNGSGKSTLLKCLAGIYAADGGSIYVDGRMATFIELGVGFNMDLPARDNVLINGAMLGLSPREVRRRFDRVIAFAELEDFVDLKLKNYSSGMLVRLAFAVMIQVDADILLIDEVLAVGDAAFQQKCFDEFGRLRREGTTVLFVTHDMSAVQRFCDRVMLLEGGRRVALGEPQEVAARYLELNFSLEARAEEAAAAGAPAPAEEPEPDPLPEGAVQILDAWFEDEAGRRVDALAARRPCRFRIRVRFNVRETDPLFGVHVRSASDVLVFGAHTGWEPPSGVFEAGEEALVGFAFDALLAPGTYTASPSVGRGGEVVHDHRPGLVQVQVTGGQRPDGLLDLPTEITVEHRAPSRAEVSH